MHLIYKQDFYTDKQKEIDKLLIEHLVPIMDDLYHPMLIEEWKQNINATAYENNLNQDVKIPSIKKKYRNNKNEYWPTRIKESINWLHFYISCI